MNIFILDSDPFEAAKMLCDKHIVKMCLETAQILSTINGGPYKSTHANHPCTKWAGASTGNYKWLVQHGIGIAEEYTYRFNKSHKCQDVIMALEQPVVDIENKPLVNFVMAMPDEFREVDVTEAYRNYYMSKKSFCNWTKREIPEWFLEKLNVQGS